MRMREVTPFSRSSRFIRGAGWTLAAVATGWLATPQRCAALERELVVSVFQGACREGDFAANLATARDVVKQARERGSHFLALPECFLSGCESREAVQRGARLLDDPDLKQFKIACIESTGWRK